MLGDCIFCQIVAGEVPCFKIYEDDEFLAFLDVFPLTPGHTLVIPKKHYRWVWDVKPVGKYFEVITKIANHFRKELGDDLMVSMTFGEDVPHAHYHLLPDSENISVWFKKYGELKQHEMIDKSEAKRWVEKLGLGV